MNTPASWAYQQLLTATAAMGQVHTFLNLAGTANYALQGLPRHSERLGLLGQRTWRSQDEVFLFFSQSLARFSG